MADKTMAMVDIDSNIVQRWKDLGDGTWAPVVAFVALSTLQGTAGYPFGSVPVVATSGLVANAQAQASLPATAGKTTYITGFQVTGGGATLAALVNAALTGILGGPLNYSYGGLAGILSLNQPLIVQFNPPLPASAMNQAITLTLPALGAGNLAACVSMQGFQL